MRIGRTLPPSAAPLTFLNIINGFKGIIQGDKGLKVFQSQLNSYFNTKYCYLTSSGKAALTLILETLHELSPHKTEVLIPAFTCYSVPSAIIRAGLKVRLCDMEHDSLDFDSCELKSIITDRKQSSKILAVIPTHLFGFQADILKLRTYIDKRNIFIIEDAAQAMGVRFINGKMAGTCGDIGFFSLGRGKAYSAVEGGIVITSRKDIADILTRQMEKISKYSIYNTFKLIIYSFVLLIFTNPYMFWLPKLVPFFGLGKTVFATDFKINSMSSYQSGLAFGWQNRLEKFKKKRDEIFRQYMKRFKTSTNHHVPLNGTENNEGRGLIRFPVIFKNSRERFMALQKSKRLGLGIMPGYPDSINCISHCMIMDNKIFPVAESIADLLVTLPTHEYVTQKDIKTILNCVLKGD